MLKFIIVILTLIIGYGYYNKKETMEQSTQTDREFLYDDWCIS